MVLLGRSPGSLAEEGGQGQGSTSDQDLEGRLRRSVQESAQRLLPHLVGLVEWRHEPESGASLPEVVGIMDRLRAEGTIAGWILSVGGSGPLPNVGAGDGEARAGLFSGDFSALNAGLRGPLAERSLAASTGFFARDPLGSGKLDGTLFTHSVTDRRPTARPINVRDLRREFDPVLRLGFLTEGRQRTLAQASLRFVLRWPWVCSALVPLPSPERLDELVRTETTPPLTDAEVERLLALPSSETRSG